MVKPKEKHAMLNQNEDMVTSDFDFGSEPDLDIICNMISILPIEYDTVT